jgi:hypothetical protein
MNRVESVSAVTGTELRPLEFATAGMPVSCATPEAVNLGFFVLAGFANCEAAARAFHQGNHTDPDEAVEAVALGEAGATASADLVQVRRARICR